MIPGSANPLLLASAAEAGAYQIERSLRFNSSDSAYLSRTPASAGNRKTWTWAGWVKRSAIAFSADQHIWGVTGVTDATYGEMFFGTGDTLRFAVGYNTAYGITTTRVFRDPGAWYHIVLAFDATQGTAANKIKLYINGAEETTFSSDNRSSLANQDWGYNNNVAHYIGRNPNSDIRHFNGCLADCFLIDGQALDPTSFGEFDTNGIWQPIAYSGSYGTNGFHLPFSDNSTAAALGTDTSGNSNTWTVNNISVTAGSGNDSLVDTPSSGSQVDTGLGGQVTGNYCTLNPLVGSSGAKASLSNGSLQFTNAAVNSYYDTGGTFGMSSGKWYFELNATTLDSNRWAVVGIANAAYDYADNTSNGVLNAWTHYSNGGYYLNSTIGTGSGTYATGDVVMVAFDADSGKLWFGKNGTWNSGSPAAGTTPVATVSSGTYFPVVRVYTHTTVPVVNLNFGQRQWAYAAPAGFKALCTTNLDTPLIAKPSEVMDVKTYTGNGGTQTITGLGFSPDLVWIKSRTDAFSHRLQDTVRGVKKELNSDLTTAEYTYTVEQGLTAFNSDGFTLIDGASANGAYNKNNSAFVAWTWNAGSSTVTNTQGSITSQVRANPSAGFSIVSYTGTGTSPVSVGHGLNVAPTFLIFKNRDDAVNWQVWTTAISSSGTIWEGLNTTSAGTTPWTYVSTTSSLIQFNSGNSAQTTNSKRFICYAFSPVDGYSNGFSYTGNGSTDGSFVYLGFRPRLILLKCSSTTGNWTLVDTAREGYNVDNDPLYPNLSNAEGTTDLLDITSNGFKLRTTDASVNSNAATYIGFAWAESPFNYSRAR